MEVLLFLAARPGEPVSREELLSGVWPGVLVGDDVLTQAVTKLRKALGDDARSPSYIETISKRGYRLVAPVDAPDGVSSARVSSRTGNLPTGALLQSVSSSQL
jgi:DNA-binding winged helix-turn-helix (wHTH) protein